MYFSLMAVSQMTRDTAHWYSILWEILFPRSRSCRSFLRKSRGRTAEAAAAAKSLGCICIKGRGCKSDADYESCYEVFHLGLSFLI